MPRGIGSYPQLGIYSQPGQPAWSAASEPVQPASPFQRAKPAQPWPCAGMPGNGPFGPMGTFGPLWAHGPGLGPGLALAQGLKFAGPGPGPSKFYCFVWGPGYRGEGTLAVLKGATFFVSKSLGLKI